MELQAKFSEYIHHGEHLTCDGYSLLIDYERLKSLVKNCDIGEGIVEGKSKGNRMHDSIEESAISCSGCHQILLNEVERQVRVVVGRLNSGALRLLRPDLVSGYQRYYWYWWRSALRSFFGSRHHRRMIEGSRHLMLYLAVNAIAVNKLLTKYDRVHGSVKGLNLKAKSTHLMLKSPWLIELCAFQMNTTSESSCCEVLWGSFSCNFKVNDNDSGPVITCTLLKSVNVEFNLTCPICLDTVFDPMALGCGHIFCNSCACTNASIPTIFGVKSANKHAQCPMCRQTGVYADSVHLVQLGLLLKKRCKDQWKERLQTEREERIKQTKDHWDKQSRLFLGL